MYHVLTLVYLIAQITPWSAALMPGTGPVACDAKRFGETTPERRRFLNNQVGLC